MSHYGQLGFVDSLERLAGDAAYAHTDVMGTSVGKFSRALRELESARYTMMEQARNTIAHSMESFINDELRNARDAGENREPISAHVSIYVKPDLTCAGILYVCVCVCVCVCVWM